MLELKAVVASQNPDIIAVTEVLPKNSAVTINKSEYALDGYDRFENVNPARGITVYVKASLKATVEEIDGLTGFRESLFCKMKVSDGKCLLFGCVYRSPSSEDDNTENLNLLLRTVSNHSAGHKCITGDFNFSEINWEKDDFPSSKSKTFKNTLDDCFLEQMVDKPTRSREGQQPTQPDLILVEDVDLISTVEHMPPLGKSDHDVLKFIIHCQKESIQATEQYQYNKGNYSEMRTFLREHDWSEYHEMNIEASWSYLKQVLEDCVSKYVPKTKLRKNINKPLWMTSEVLITVKKKNRAYKRYRKNKTAYNKQAYLTIKSQAAKQIKEAKKQFEQKIAKESAENPKAFWKYVRSKTTCKESIGTLFHNGNFAETDEDKANVLNSFFSEVFTEEDVENIPKKRWHRRCIHC